MLALLLTGFLVSTFPSAYAATIFSDGFESGDLTAWTGVTQNQGTFNVSESNIHHGSYCGLSTMNGASAWHYGYVSKQFLQSSHVFLRAYIYIDSLGGSYTPSILYLNRITQGSVAWVGVTPAGALVLNYYNGAGSTSDTSATVLNDDTQYCLELEVLISNDAGEARVYVDGVEVEDVTQTGLDNNGLGDVVSECRVGWNRGNTQVGILYLDCVVISDSYIGPEPEGEESFSLTLNAPANESTITEYTCNFNYTPTLLGSGTFYNATLYLNNTATAYNSTAIENATLNTISYVLSGQNASYLWDIKVWNSTHALFSTNGNFTLTVAVSTTAATSEEDIIAAVMFSCIIACSITGVIIYAKKKR